MATAKLFQNGCSQAVRLPKEFRQQGKEVKISKQGNKIILEPIETSMAQWLASLAQFSDDFMDEGRNQPEPPQERDWRNFLSCPKRFAHAQSAALTLASEKRCGRGTIQVVRSGR